MPIKSVHELSLVAQIGELWLKVIKEKFSNEDNAIKISESKDGKIDIEIPSAYMESTPEFLRKLKQISDYSWKGFISTKISGEKVVSDTSSKSPSSSDDILPAKPKKHVRFAKKIADIRLFDQDIDNHAVSKVLVSEVKSAGVTLKNLTPRDMLINSMLKILLASKPVAEQPEPAKSLKVIAAKPVGTKSTAASKFWAEASLEVKIAEHAAKRHALPVFESHVKAELSADSNSSNDSKSYSCSSSGR